VAALIEGHGLAPKKAGKDAPSNDDVEKLADQLGISFLAPRP